VYSAIQKWPVQLPISKAISAGIKRLETHGLPLQESMDIMKNAGQAGESVSTKLQCEKETLVFEIYQCLSGT
jgi:hypothetical protein